MDLDATQALRLIEEIAGESSRTGKEKLLTELASTTFGRFVLKMTYDPMITYGITPPQSWETGKLQLPFRQGIIEPFLMKLAHRELTGNAAVEQVAEVLGSLKGDDSKLLFKILDRDLKCGIAETTINVAVPGLLPIFSVMRAHAYQEKKVKKWPWFGEPKLDGMRCTFVCKDGNGGFFSRSGKRWPSLDHLVEPVIQVAITAVQQNESLKALMDPQAIGQRKGLSFVADGEVMTGLFATTGKVRGNDKVDNAEIHLFDIMSYENFDAVGAVGKPYTERRTDLELFVRVARELGEQKVQILPRFFLNNDGEVQAFFEKCLNWTLASYLARGDKQREQELLPLTIDKETGEPKCLEGAIVKNPEGLYEKKKGYTWMKLKAEDTEDLPITGAFPGEPGTKYENCLGGVIVSRNGVSVRVGGGFSDAQRLELWDLWQKDVAGSVGVILCQHLRGRLIEVKFHEVTPDGSLRHPRFVRFRDDKAGEVDKVAA